MTRDIGGVEKASADLEARLPHKIGFPQRKRVVKFVANSFYPDSIPLTEGRIPDPCYYKGQ